MQSTYSSSWHTCKGVLVLISSANIFLHQKSGTVKQVVNIMHEQTSSPAS